MNQKRDKTGILHTNLSTLNKMHQDVLTDGVYWQFPPTSLPLSFGIPQSLMDKISTIYVATSGSIEHGRNYVMVLMDRVDKSKTPGSFVHDAHPVLTYYDLNTGMPAPTGMIWHHAYFEDRTRAIDSRFSRATIPDTVDALRACISQPISGSIKDNVFVKTAMKSEIKVLARLEQIQVPASAKMPSAATIYTSKPRKRRKMLNRRRRRQ